MTKLLIINAVPTPYRTFMFNKMYEIGKKYNIEVTVAYQVKQDARRKWDTGAFEQKFPHYFSKNLYGEPRDHFSYTVLNFDIIRDVASGKYDYLMFAPLNSITGWICSQLATRGKKILWSEGNITKARYKSWLVSKFKGFFTRKFDILACPGIRALEYLEVLRPSILKRPNLYLPNIVDTSYFARRVEELKSSKNEIRRELGLNNDSLVFFSMGRLVHLKGYDRLIEAAEKISRNSVNAVFYIAGSGPEQSTYQTMIKQKKLDQKVFLLGELNMQEVVKWLAVSDWFLHTSRRDCSPLVIVEAANAGLPLIVSSQTGNSPEAVEVGNNGFIFDINNIEELINILQKACYLSKSEVEAMGDKSKSIAEKKFNPDRVISEFFDKLASL